MHLGIIQSTDVLNDIAIKGCAIGPEHYMMINISCSVMGHRCPI